MKVLKIDFITKQAIEFYWSAYRTHYVMSVYVKICNKIYKFVSK